MNPLITNTYETEVQAVYAARYYKAKGFETVTVEGLTVRCFE